MSKDACPFCAAETLVRAVAYYGTVFAVADRFPVAEGHLLVISRRHVADWFALDDGERRDAETLLLRLRERILAGDPTVSGFNIGMNCGGSAGQTIFHAHVHLIPRRSGDTPDPAGGVRGVIPGKRKYSQGHF
jgi:diadenosine tetraphosphate (Ap4A) HIT family hydrolase